MRISDAATVLRSEGCVVVEESGWKGRDNGRTFAYIRGATIHHTGGSIRSTVDAEIHTLIYGRPGLPGPISQFMVGRNGVWYCIADGCANHNKIGWAGPNEGYGNSHLIGIECQHSGSNEDWTRGQYESLVVGTAALALHYNFPYSHIGGHKEHQPGEKVDPSFNMNVFRTNVQRVIEGDMLNDTDIPIIRQAVHGTEIGRSGITFGQALDIARKAPDRHKEIIDRLTALESRVEALAGTGGITPDMLKDALRDVLGSLDN